MDTSNPDTDPVPVPPAGPVPEESAFMVPEPSRGHPLAPVQVDLHHLLSFFDPIAANETLERLGWCHEEMLERLVEIARDPAEKIRDQMAAMKMIADRAQATITNAAVPGLAAAHALPDPSLGNLQVQTLRESATRTMSILRLISDTEEAAVQEQKHDPPAFALPRRVFNPSAGLAEGGSSTATGSPESGDPPPADPGGPPPDDPAPRSDTADAATTERPDDNQK